MKEIASGIFMMEKSWGCNVYFLKGEELSLVDSGFPLDSKAVIKHSSELASNGPDLVIATHCHLDHMGSMARVKTAFGSTVVAHVLDAPIMEGKEPYPTFKLKPLQAVYYKLLAPLYPYECVQVDRTVVHGDVVDVMGGLEVVHVPGHTRGSIGLYNRERGALFTGDTVRNEGGVLDGPPPQFTPDVDEAYRGIFETMLPLDFEIILPGHGEPVLVDAHRKLEEMIDLRRGATDG